VRVRCGASIAQPAARRSGCDLSSDGDLSTLEDPLALDAIKDLMTSTEHEE
jgi:hypothetical protein